MVTQEQAAVKIVYRGVDERPVDVAILSHTEQGDYVFRYLEGADTEFPGFPLDQKEYSSKELWEPITFRIPEIVKKRSKDETLLVQLLETEGKLVTDRFEFVPLATQGALT